MAHILAKICPRILNFSSDVICPLTSLDHLFSYSFQNLVIMSKFYSQQLSFNQGIKSHVWSTLLEMPYLGWFLTHLSVSSIPLCILLLNHVHYLDRFTYTVACEHKRCRRILCPSSNLMAVILHYACEE